jgi:hypothetical protein
MIEVIQKSRDIFLFPAIEYDIPITTKSSCRAQVYSYRLTVLATDLLRAGKSLWGALMIPVSIVPCLDVNPSSCQPAMLKATTLVLLKT